MALDRTTLRATAATERRPAVATTVQRSAAATERSPARRLQECLGNHATQAFVARSIAAPAKEGSTHASAPVSVPEPPSVQLSRATRLPAKVSKPNDAAELEAEETARKVVRMSEPRSPATTSAKGSAPGVVQRAEATPALAAAAPPSTARVHIPGGSPLPPAVRSFMEPRFGASFGHVRIHTGEAAARQSADFGAQAFTIGEHLFFGSEKFQPQSASGRELIAHELTHTIQQGAAVQRSVDTTATQRSEPRVQRLGVGDALGSRGPESAAQIAESTREKAAPTRETASSEEASETPGHSEIPEGAAPAREHGPNPLAAVLTASSRRLEAEAEIATQRMWEGREAEVARVPAAPTIQFSLLSGLRGAVGRGLDWLSENVVDPIRGWVSSGWATLSALGDRIAEAYRQANATGWDILQPGYLLFRTLRNLRRRLFSEAIAEERRRRGALPAQPVEEGRGLAAAPGEPSTLERLDSVMDTVEGGAESVFGVGREMLEGAVLGDFQENPTTWNTIGQIVVGFIPYAGQVADVRDLIASVQKLRASGWRDGWEWFNLILVGIGFIPGVGDIIKGVGRGLKNTLKELAGPLLRRARGLWQEIVRRAPALLDAARRHGRRLLDAATNAGRRLWQGAQDLGRRALGSARSAWDSARRLFASVRDRAQGLAASIASRARAVAERARGLVQRVASALSGAVRRALDSARNLVSEGADLARRILQRGQEALARLSQRIADGVRRATDFLADSVRQAIARGRELYRAARRRMADLIQAAVQRGRALVAEGYNRVSTLIRSGLRWVRERAVRWVAERLRALKERVLAFLKRKWEELKGKLGIKKTFSRTQQELDDLARDPGQGFKITPGSLNERRVGLDLESRGQLPGPIRRDPNPAGGDFIDAHGIVWDVKSFQSGRPVRKGGFEITVVTNKIRNELGKSENLILDTLNLNRADLQQLRAAVAQNGWANRILWWP